MRMSGGRGGEEKIRGGFGDDGWKGVRMSG